MFEVIFDWLVLAVAIGWLKYEKHACRKWGYIRTLAMLTLFIAAGFDISSGYKMNRTILAAFVILWVYTVYKMLTLRKGENGINK